MKSIFKLSALALLATALTVSCEKEMDTPDEVAGEKVIRTFTMTFAQPDTKVAITNEGKTSWEAGDEIYIHGKAQSEAKVVTLTAENISADGKKAVIEVDVTGMQAYDPDGFYACYPADAVHYFSSSSSCYYYGEFGNTNRPLMAAYQKGDNFVFYNLCSVLTFEVTGDFDSYVVAGNNGEYVGYDNYQVKVNSEEQNYKRTCDAPKKTLEAPLKDGVNYVYFPNGVNFSAGFNIKFKKDGEVLKVAKTEKPVEIARNKILALGDITAQLKDFEKPTVSDHKSEITNAQDLSALQANCFVITAAGAYKFPSLKGNSTEATPNVFGAELVWETYNNNSAVTKNSVISKVDFEDNWIYFQTSEDLLPGNALIAATDYDGNILWSWHIWIPKTTIETNTYGVYNAELMDRNLGALVAAEVGSPAPAESFGMTYQWGRKDPFVGPKANNSGSNATVAGTEVSASSGTFTVEESIAKPTVLAYTPDADWVATPDNTLWQDDTKTVYDPCPAGYKVPARDKEQPLMGDLSTLPNWEENAANVYVTFGDPQAVFPVSGYRDDYSPKSYSKVAQRVAYWTSYASADTKGYCLNIRLTGYGDTHSLAETPKARGAYVRCVKFEGGSEPAVEPAKDGDILWAEDWTGAENKMDMSTYTFTGTTVYGGGTVNYSFVNGGSTTYTYVDNNMDGSTSQPNLLLSKTGGKWTIEGIPAAGATVATLTFNVNNNSSLSNKVALSSPTEGVTIGNLEVSGDTKPFTVKYAITLSDVKTFTLEFSNTNSSNIRIDDIKLVVGAGSEPEQPKEPAVEHLVGWYSGENLWGANVTAINVTAAGYGMVRGIAMDDEYIYMPKASAYPAIAAVKISDPATQVAGDVSTVDAGDTFKSSFVRMMKNTDANVNGGKDILLMSNCSAANGGNIVIYAYTNGISAAPIKLAQFAWDSVNNVEDWRRYGDRFFVTGTWQEGKIWLPSFAACKVVVLSVANGARTAVEQFEATEDVLPEGIKDLTIWEGTDTQYLVTNNSLGNMLAPGNGTGAHGWGAWILNYAETNAVGTWGYNFFEFNGEKYIAYAKLSGKKAWVEVIKQGVNLGRSLSVPQVVFQIPILSATDVDAEQTADVTIADCSVRVIGEEVYIAALTRDGGFTLDKIVMK